MVLTIEHYLRLSVTDCRKMGFFKPDSVMSGNVSWYTNGQRTASISLTTDTRNDVALLLFKHDGEAVTETIRLSFKQSNLKGNAMGYYYFVCPVTNLRCRNLYLVSGRFVSRQAFRPMYSQQAKSHRQRSSILSRRIDLLIAVSELQKQRYRNETYKGRQTPYGHKVEKLLDKAARLFPIRSTLSKK